MACDKFSLKTFQFKVDSGEVELITNLKLAFEAAAVSISCFYDLRDILLFAVCKKSSSVTCCSAIDGSLHYLKVNKIDKFKPFTCMSVHNNEIYAGSKGGSVYVFESRSGTFIKEIPF